MFVPSILIENFLFRWLTYYLFYNAQKKAYHKHSFICENFYQIYVDEAHPIKNIGTTLLHN